MTISDVLSDPLVKGAISGFVSALLVDLHAYTSNDGPFNWKKAAARWLMGTISGATAAAGLGAL